MKQHISVKQLNELSEKGFDKLVEWWEKKLNRRVSKDKEYIASATTIGEMIEFLGPRLLQIKVVKRRLEGNSDEVDIFLEHRVTLDSKSFVSLPNLADALWSACKEVLNEETR